MIWARLRRTCNYFYDHPSYSRTSIRCVRTETSASGYSPSDVHHFPPLCIHQGDLAVDVVEGFVRSSQCVMLLHCFRNALRVCHTFFENAGFEHVHNVSHLRSYVVRSVGLLSAKVEVWINCVSSILSSTAGWEGGLVAANLVGIFEYLYLKGLYRQFFHNVCVYFMTRETH